MLKPNAYYDDMRKQGFGDEDGVLMNGISALIKDTSESSITMQDTARKCPSVNKEVGSHPTLKLLAH